MKKKILISVVVFLAVFASTTAIKAGVSENISGWIWGGSEDASLPGAMGVIDGNESGVGWISMNSANCDTNNDGKSEGYPATCPPVGTVMASYGVNIPVVGQITGYAHSENVGDIDFNPHFGCPGSPKYAGACDAYPTAFAQDATRNADNTITGWARFVEIAKANAVGNSGGWTGWIRMDGTNFGVKVGVGADKNLSGNAYSEELGLISFSGSGYAAHFPYPPTVALAAVPAIINIETNPNWNTTGVPIKLTWSDITNTTSCKTLWDGVTAPVLAGSTYSTIVTQNTTPVTYKITCYGQNGAEDVTVSTMAVETYCNNTDCGNGTCNESPNIGATNISQCTKSCSSDSECAPRVQTKWMEVAP